MFKNLKVNESYSDHCCNINILKIGRFIFNLLTIEILFKDLSYLTYPIQWS